jgi:hypothetical protein
MGGVGSMCPTAGSAIQADLFSAYLGKPPASAGGCQKFGTGAGLKQAARAFVDNGPANRCGRPDDDTDGAVCGHQILVGAHY